MPQATKHMATRTHGHATVLEVLDVLVGLRAWGFRLAAQTA